MRAFGTKTKSHIEYLIDQFTRQGPGFQAGTPLRDADALNTVVKLANLRSGDRVLDLGCGPGIVACRFGAEEQVKHVLGIDMNDTMLELARQERDAAGLSEERVEFRKGDALQSGLPEGAADVVVLRFVLHHQQEPRALLREARRLAARRVVVVDVTPRTDAVDALDALEKKRDRSHVHFLPQQELAFMMREEGLGPAMEVEGYRIQSTLEEWLQRSHFESDQDRQAFLQMLQVDLEEERDRDVLDLGIVSQGGQVLWSHPVSILAADKQ